MKRHKHDPNDDTCIAEAEEVEPGSSDDAAIWEGKCLVTGEIISYEAYNNDTVKIIGTRKES